MEISSFLWKSALITFYKYFWRKNDVIFITEEVEQRAVNSTAHEVIEEAESPIRKRARHISGDDDEVSGKWHFILDLDHAQFVFYRKFGIEIVNK